MQEIGEELIDLNEDSKHKKDNESNKKEKNKIINNKL